MTKVEITIGWTIHDRDCDPASRDYMPFMDVYRPGQPQHTETITVDLPDISEHPVNVSGQDLADHAFYATNASYVAPDSIAAQIAAAIEATGYRGQGAHYSLSVGDTVTVQGVTYGCAGVGWEVIES